MLKVWKMSKFPLLLCIIPLAFSGPVIDWKGKRYPIIKNYLKIQKKYFQQLCQGGEHIYDELNRKFNGSIFFVPHINYSELDRDAIENNFALVEDKLRWVRKEKEKLLRKKNFDVEKELYRELKGYFEQVVDIKQRFYELPENRKSILAQGHQKVQLLHKKMTELLDRISFIRPFGHPVDHFSMRREYDGYKIRKDVKGQKLKNDILFKRRVFEDGAQNPNHTKSDRFFRALTNTIEIQFKNQKDIISEDFRYDFDSFLNTLQRYLKRGKSFHLQRIEEWLDRTQRKLDFYLDILQESRQQYTKSMLQGMSQARHQLMKFNFEKQRKVYDFWLQQSELNRALFTLETILFNEVGGIDGRDALERRDVVQVVINRIQLPFYRTIEKDEMIYPYLESIGEKKLAQRKWLNVMFKEGEFSFTYFFIPSSKKIYCPDMSRRGRFLRRENLKIVLDMLKKSNREFKAIRYFSRASMLGRINMAKIWTDFKALPQRPGKRSMKNSLLKKLYKNGKYRFLYKFYDDREQTYYVLEIKGRGTMSGKVYVYDPVKKDFFNYRNPHLFTYFVPQ